MNLTNISGLKVSLLAVLGIFFACSSSWGATYYLDTVNGNNSNTGLSSSAAWQTIAKVNSSTFQPGDNILFRSGQTWREQLTIPSAGKSGSPITFGAYGSGAKPVINGANIVTGWSLYSGSIYSASLAAQPKRVYWGTTELTYNSSLSLGSNQFGYSSGRLYVNIGQDPTSQAIEASQRKYNVYINKSYIVFDGLQFSKTDSTAIGQWDYESDYCVVRNCTIDHTGKSGLYSGQSTTQRSVGWTVEDNVFDHIGLDNVHDQGVYTRFGLNWTIQRNTFTNVAAFAVDLNGSSYAIVRDNYYTGVSTSQGFLQFDEDMSGAADAAGPSLNNQVYYNLAVGGKRLIYEGGGPDHKGNKIYNNTAYNYTYAGINLEANNTDLTVVNNILWSTVSNAKAYRAESGCTISSSSNNDLGPAATAFIMMEGSSYNSLSSYRSAFPSLDANSISSDPLFVKNGSDFHLSSSSPCVAAGVNLNITSDFSGNPVPAAPSKPDLGAYQSHILPAPTNLAVQ